MPRVTIDGKLTKENRTVYTGTDVVEAAKIRLRKIFDRYDKVFVSFSGGKDSLVVLHLVRQIKIERGDLSPVDVIFYDEELIPDVIVDFVNAYRQMEWINMRWLAVPLESHKFILGKTLDYIQWDPNREHVRQKPAWAISDDSKVYDQYTVNEMVARDYAGKLISCLGLRASESLTRYRSIVNKINETFVAQSKHPRVDIGRPIYDWSEEDIFKFLYDNNIAYCDIYDHQQAAGLSLRVSTPLHSEAARCLDKLREVDPGFYERVLKCFPEVAIQGRYHSQVESKVDTSGIKNLEALSMFIEQEFRGEQLKMARARLKEVKKFWEDEFGRQGYPINYVAEQFMKGKVKRVILPLDETGQRRYKAKKAKNANKTMPI